MNLIMSNICKVFLFLLLVTSTVLTQNLYICESYTEDGSPIGPVNRLEIKPYGTAIYVLLENEKELNDPILYLFVDKLVDGKFSPFDSKTLNVKNEDTWAVTSFEFKEQGIYEVYFLNSSQSRLASNKIEVFFSDEYLIDSNPIVTRSFGECQFIFCELVIDGKPTNLLNSVSLSISGGKVFIYLNNYVPFGIENIKIQVWDRSKTNNNYEKLVNSKKFKILPEWSDTFFRYKFNKIGEYRIDIFDNSDNFISSNIITVIN